MIWLWIAFLLFVFVMLALDLGVFHRHAHEVSMKEALCWSLVWVALALACGVFVYCLYEYRLWGLIAPGQPTGRQAATLFLSGYLVEESLSADNIFVIAMIFTYFAVPSSYQHRVLFWGILGAIVLRGLMILAGIALIQQFGWIMYVFGALLLYSAYRMLTADEAPDPQKNPFVRLVKKLLPVTEELDGTRFIVKRDGRRFLTPLAIVLVSVEGADVLFAVDSIPAIFAITDIPFIVFTSNIFAILGLRSMFFALSSILKKFHYLKISLSVLLGVIGLKMLLKDYVHDLPGRDYITLGLIVLILGVGIVASIRRTRRHAKAGQGT